MIVWIIFVSKLLSSF